jgi:hypothetical protein
LFRGTNIPPPPVTRRIAGLDLGKAVDPTALCVLDWTWPGPPRLAPPGAARSAAGPWRPDYNVTALKRWPLGTSYVDIVQWLVRLFQQPGFRPEGGPPPVLVADETGVGVAVVEMIREALIRARLAGYMVSVTITAGSAVSLVEGGKGRWRVAKKQLASVLVTLFSGHRLHIAEVPERAVLIKEAQAFSVKITPEGNETIESWREAEHDDLVLALALACWAAEWIDWRGVLPWPPGQPWG